MKNKAPKVPKLRFPGFSDEWIMKSLQKFADFQEGPGIMAVDFKTSGTPLIRLSGLSGTEVTLDGCNYLNPDKVNSKWGHFKLRTGDLLISSSASLGMVCEVKEKAKDSICYTGIIRFRPIKNLANKEFIKQLLSSEDFIKQTTSMSTGATMHHFGPTHLKKMSFVIPSINEQQEIAGFLTVVDERISVLDKKVELLNKYKKGVMQKIFSQKLRFKDENGKDFPEWRYDKLKNIATKVSERNTTNVGKVLTNSATLGIVSQQEYFDKDIAVQGNLSNYYLVQVDDFVYNPRISTNAPVGPFKRNKYDVGLMSPLYTIYRPKSVEDVDFLELYFNTSYWHKYMKSVANYGARHDRMAISSTELDNLPIPVLSKNESQKINSFIRDIEAKIYLQERKLVQAKKFKKALLQRMFV